VLPRDCSKGLFVFEGDVVGKRIKGGYYLKARCIRESAIAHSSPCVRELWDYLLREANHRDVKYDGFVIKRGQLFKSYRQIRDDLSWHVGYRKQRYSENQMKKGMKHLAKELMITTTKKPRGVLITISNYDYFQNPENYEGTNEGTNEGTTKEPRRNQRGTPINKNEKNEKKEDISKDISLSRNGVPYSEIIAYLNQQTGRRFRSDSPKTRTLIKTLWNRNYRLEDFQRVVDNKVADWLNHPKYSKFLRPETLFGPKFEGYLNEPQNTLAGIVSEKTVKTIQNLKSLELD